MKRIQIIIPVLLGAFCTGCDLDIEPQDRYDQQTFWYSAKAAEGGLTGCYNALLENGIYGRAAVYWEDDATPNGYNFSNDDSWTTIANGAQTATSGASSPTAGATPTKASDAVIRCWTTSTSTASWTRASSRSTKIRRASSAYCSTTC